MAIKEPPKPKPVAQAAKAAPAKQTEPGQAEGGGEEAPVSRAEQIRQRIAERREELRREQEAQEQGQQTNRGQQQTNQGSRQRGRSQQADEPSAYQEAIQAKIRNSSKDKGGNNEEDG